MSSARRCRPTRSSISLLGHLWRSAPRSTARCQRLAGASTCTERATSSVRETASTTQSARRSPTRRCVDRLAAPGTRLDHPANRCARASIRRPSTKGRASGSPGSSRHEPRRLRHLDLLAGAGRGISEPVGVENAVPPDLGSVTIPCKGRKCSSASLRLADDPNLRFDAARSTGSRTRPTYAPVHASSPNSGAAPAAGGELRIGVAAGAPGGRGLTEHVRADAECGGVAEVRCGAALQTVTLCRCLLTPAPQAF